MKTEMNVKGMTCNHCVMAVKGALKGLDGVSEVEVSLETGKVLVHHDENPDRMGEFKSAVEGQGYDVE